MEEEKPTTTNNSNNKIVVCIEEYPSIKNQVDGKDSPTIKKKEQTYELPSCNKLHADGIGGHEIEDDGGEKTIGLENVPYMVTLAATKVVFS